MLKKVDQHQELMGSILGREHPPSKLCGKLFSSFVKSSWQTNQPTNKTDLFEYVTSSVKVMSQELHLFPLNHCFHFN